MNIISYYHRRIQYAHATHHDTRNIYVYACSVLKSALLRNSIALLLLLLLSLRAYCARLKIAKFARENARSE